MTEVSEFKPAATSSGLESMPPLVLRIDAWLAVVGGLILFVTMIMTAIDVIGRYVFNSPLGFAYEMTELLMATVVFVSVASVTLRNEHITIGLFDNVWTGRLRAARDLVIALFIAICMAFLCYRLFLFTGRFIRYGDITNMLKLPLYPVAAFGALGVGFASLAALALAFNAARRLIRGP